MIIENELRSIMPIENEQGFQATLAEFRERISGLEPWQQDAETKLLFDEVRDKIEADPANWQAVAARKLEKIDAMLLDDVLRDEERNKIEDAERRARCEELGRKLAN